MKKQLGVALSEGVLASGLTVVFRGEALPRIKQLVKLHCIDKVVIGLPSGSLVPEIREFGELLKKETSIAVVFYDETLTTSIGKTLLLQTGASKKARSHKEHELAAALILQTYIENGK